MQVCRRGDKEMFGDCPYYKDLDSTTFPSVMDIDYLIKKRSPCPPQLRNFRKVR